MSADPFPDASGPAPTDPPKRGRGRPRKQAAGPAGPAPKSAGGRPPARDVRARKVAGLYGQLGMTAASAGLGLAMMTPESETGTMLLNLGTVLSEHADELGAAWADWAETSSRVAKMIDRMTFGGAGLTLLVAHWPIVTALMGKGDGAPIDIPGTFRTILGGGLAEAPAAPAA